MGDKVISQTLQTLIDLVEQSRQLRDRAGITQDEIRRVDVMIDWTLEALRERIASEMVVRSAIVRPY